MLVAECVRDGIRVGVTFGDSKIRTACINSQSQTHKILITLGMRMVRVRIVVGVRVKVGLILRVWVGVKGCWRRRKGLG